LIKLLKKFLGQDIKVNSTSEIENSKHFCMVPWVHIHGLPDGKVIPCCVSPYDQSYGDLKKNSIKEVWNNGKFRTMRRLMRSDRPVFTCTKCYELDKSGIESMRTRMNRIYKKDVHLVSSTHENGALNSFEMKYLDFRFSNICNFKCRGCSPALSTKWFEDHQKLWDFKSKEPKLVNIAQSNNKLWGQLTDLLPTVESAYFAGGEPLLMDEHYHCLEYLIENNKTNVELSYNTNLSILKFKKYDLIDLWSKFDKIFLSISLDDIEERGEYFRSGLDWKKLLENLDSVKNVLPNIHISVNCTISLFNISRIPEIHSFLLNRGIIDEYGFIFNTLQDPIRYRTQVLTETLKLNATKKFNAYLRLLNEKQPNRDWKSFSENYGHQIFFMNTEDQTHNLKEFKKVTIKLDEIREESFKKTYPELMEMFE
jgi:MoaA/NifB/PqqE/SkfB family radical SAM enzyme